MQLSALAGRLSFLKRLDRLVPVLFVLSLALVSFIGGAYVAEFDMPIYQSTLKPSFRGLRALDEQRQWEDTLEKHGWYSARDNRIGTTKYNRNLAYNGLTLYTTSGEPTTARLISMKGKLVHQWHLPFRQAWPDAAHVPSPMPEDRIHWHCVRLLPNGDLIADYVAVAGKPYGYGLVKMDRNSNVIWRYSDNAHHDFDIDAAGRIYGLRHSFCDERVNAARHLQTPMLDDSVIVLSPEGKELQRIRIFDAFAKSKFQSYLQSIESNRKGDHTHTNGIDVITKAFASKHDFCSAGDVMLSLRNPNLLAILDLDREEIVWAARGIWQQQHDCDPLANGNIMLFDNLGRHAAAGGRSRILEWNPKTGAIEWWFGGHRDHPFESDTRGGQQLLPNGNVLVTESNNGRIFEVTRDGKVVWEFCNPDRPGKSHELVAVVCSALRYKASKLTFLANEKIAQASARNVAPSSENDD